ncbi:MAG: hypothetical protein ACRD3O_08680 [Terriglobia bacterium]
MRGWFRSRCFRLSHHRPIGVEGVEHEGVDETAVGLVETIDQPSRRRQLAFKAGICAIAYLGIFSAYIFGLGAIFKAGSPGQLPSPVTTIEPTA